MSQIPPLYDNLFSYLRQQVSGPTTQILNMALFVYGVFKARSCALGSVADELPLEGNRQSRIRRLKRFLKNLRVRPQRVYRTLLVAFVSKWSPSQELVIILDRTEVCGFNILFAAVAFRGRAIPLSWDILDHKGACCFAEQKELLDFIDPILPQEVKVVLMADSEFRGQELFTYAVSHWWDYALGHKGDTYIFCSAYPDGRRLDSLPVKPESPVYINAVRLTRAHQFGPVNVIAYWDDENTCTRYRITNRVANGKTLRWMRQRGWIEGMFRDFKSGGFQVQNTRLEHTERLDRLLFVLSLALLWFVAIGRQVVKEGNRRVIDRGPRRLSTYFQLGWRWLKRLDRLNQPLPCLLHVYT
jgi:hypothetical protein